MQSLVLIATLAMGATRAPVCWPDADRATLDALVAATPNVELSPECRRAACEAANRWCLGWSPERRALLLWSGRTTLERRVGVEASSLSEAVRTRGAATVSVYLESLAVEAELTRAEPRRRPVARVVREPPPVPEVQTTTTSTSSPPPAPSSPPAPPVSPAARVVSSRGDAVTSPAPLRLEGEAAARFRSPGAWTPSFAVRGALGLGEGDAFAVFARARFDVPARDRAGSLTVDVWSLGGDVGLDFGFFRAPGWRLAAEGGVTVEWLSVREIREGGDVTRDGATAGGFVGLALRREWGPIQLGLFATGLGFPSGLTLQKDGEEVRISELGFRGGATLGVRL